MQHESWDGFEGIDSTERILRAALDCDAKEVHISSDGEGATIFFLSPERIEFFRHISDRCWDALQAYLRDLSGIDQWRPPPANGFGVFGKDDATHSIEVQVIKGSHGQDIIIKVGKA